jgi:hypothetical protein
MKTKTAALIAVPGVAAVILGGGVAAAATHQPHPAGTPQQTQQVQVWQPCGSGQQSGTRVTTTRTTATSLPAASGVCHPTGTVTPATHRQDPRPAVPATRHIPVSGHTTVSHQGTVNHHTSSGDRHHGSDYGDHDGGDCH